MLLLVPVEVSEVGETVMSATGLKRMRLASWGARFAYLASMMVVAVICYKFYTDQGLQNSKIESVRALIHQFSITDQNMAKLSEKAFKISELLPSKQDDAGLKAALAGKSFKERKAYLANLPADGEIISHKTALSFLQKKVRSRWVEREDEKSCLKSA